MTTWIRKILGKFSFSVNFNNLCFREEMSLLGVLNNYNKGNYKLNPVVVQEQDYNVYYGGISNGLLWPALHNLPEYIVSDYDDPKVSFG